MVLKKAISTPADGVTPPGPPSEPPLLERSRSDGIVVVQKQFRTGQLQFTDVMLKQFIEDDARSFVSCGKAIDTEVTNDWTVVCGGSVAEPLAARTPLPADAAVWRCAICLEEQQTGSIPESQLCGQPDCSDRFCFECLSQYCLMAVEGSKFMVLPVRCPSPACKRRVPTSHWIKYVPDSSYQEYVEAARAILMFRCPACHSPNTLFKENVSTEQSRGILKELLGKAMVNNPGSVMTLKESWFRFSAGIASPDDVLDSLLSVLGHQEMSFDAWPIARLFEEQEAESFLSRLLPTIKDIERRTVFHLATLRRHPNIFTPCCKAAICWKCKVAGHHEGQTCEEIQRAELEVDVQFCPGCGVGTEKTEGCDHMICLCGAEWTWDNGQEDTEW